MIAGAGSGKSTTLILRLLVLHKLLNIPLDQMHVFSFTRASTRDFQEKLAQRLACWEERVEQRSVSEERRAELRTSAQRVVSTFHSVIARLRSTVRMGEVAGFFDLLGERAATEEEMNHFNPFLTAKLSAQQREILNAAHTRAYDQSPEYRTFVTTLLTEETRQHWMRATSGQCLRAETEPAIWEAFLRQERAYHGFNRCGQFAPDPGFQDQRQCWYSDPYRAAVADRLRELGIPFVPLPSFPVRCPMNGGYGGEMYAAFQIGKLLLHIERDPHTTGEAAGRKLSFHERDRRKFIALYTDHFDQHKKLGPKDFVLADGRLRLSPDGERLLHGWVGFQEHASTSAAAPSVRVKLPGGLHRLHLAELLYQEGVFIESLGLEVEQVQMQGTLDLTSSVIAQMLPIFWRSFHAELTQRRYVRFHDVLSVLRQETTLRAMRGQLRHLKHLFIDEFQDVSAEMVDWLAKTLTVHVQEGGEEVSMICIGDDYQSIYGWRGSHPMFLMDCPRYFPSAQHSQVVLQENFRSRQPIIDVAEAILQDVEQKVAKHGRSVLPEQASDRSSAVHLCDARLCWGNRHRDTHVWQVFSRYVAAVLSQTAVSSLEAFFKNRADLSLFILARTNAVTAGIPRHQLGDQLLAILRQQGIQGFRHARVQVSTFHQAKGLEADFVLLLEDSLPPEPHPLREMVFSQAPFLGWQAGTYLQNVTDEARRLAYVAVTRARFGVMWVPLVDTAGSAVEDEQAVAGGNGHNDASISPQGCFTVVKRYVQTHS